MYIRICMRLFIRVRVCVFQPAKYQVLADKLKMKEKTLIRVSVYHVMLM